MDSRVYYNAVSNYDKTHDKVEYIRGQALGSLDFSEITPTADGQWLNQSKSDFSGLMPLADRQTKLAKSADNEQAVFGLYSVGVSTNRDEWVYDFTFEQLRSKVSLLISTYEEIRAESGGTDIDDKELDQNIKWTRDLKRQLQLDVPNIYNRNSARQALYRPFVSKPLYYSHNLNEMRYQLPMVFPDEINTHNKVICFPGNAPNSGFTALATDRVYSP